MTVAGSGIVGQTLIVHRPAPRDAYGDRQPGGTTHMLPNCVLAPLTGDEQETTGDQVTERMTVYAPVDSDVEATDELELPDATRWTIRGEPEKLRSPLFGMPFSSAHGLCVIHIERVTG